MEWGGGKHKKEELVGLAAKCSEVLEDKYQAKRIFLMGPLVREYFHERLDIALAVEGLLPELDIKGLTELYDLLLSGVEINLIAFEDAFESVKEKTPHFSLSSRRNVSLNLNKSFLS